jgi:hypothetical protein
MKLKFLKDYTGRETAMQSYKAGQQAEIPNAQALELIRLGVAVDTWAAIGKMYDPPAKVETAPVFSPEIGDVQITPLSDEPARATKPRKGKVKK